MALNSVIKRVAQLTDVAPRIELTAPLYYNNKMANAFRFEAVDGSGNPVDLAGATCEAAFLKSDNTTVYPILGTVDGNAAEVILPQSCYAVTGRFKLTVNLITATAIRTVLDVRGYVERNTTEDIIDPGTPVTNYAAVIAAAESAATAANEAADAATDVSEATEALVEEMQDFEATFSASLIIGTASGTIASFSDGADGAPLQSVVAEITPAQDLHGFDSPWAAGGSKNLLPMTVENLKAINTTGTWSGLAYTHAGITFTILTDAADNVIGIKVNGTASADARFDLVYQHLFAAGSYTVNGCPAGGSSSTYRIFANYIGSDTGSGSTGTLDGANTTSVFIQVKSGTAVSNQEYKPMLRLSSVEDGSFAPYTNICPISGRTGLTVTRTGKNLCGIGDFTLTMGTNRTKGFAMTTHPAGNYVLSFDVTSNTAAKAVKFAVRNVSGTPYNDISVVNVTAGQTGHYERTFTANIPLGYIYIYLSTSEANGNAASFANIQLERGSTATTYEPYQGNTLDIDWTTEAGTVYGGTLNVTTGLLTVDKAGIASYDGETLPGAWISDRDAYAAGTTPTTGAQVVYDLATPETYQLTPQEIRSLLGDNRVYTDAGDVSVVYVSDLRGHIAELEETVEEAAEAVAVYDDRLTAAEQDIDSLGTDVDGVKALARTAVISGDYSGTQSVRINQDIPAGTYRLKVDSITSADIDAKTCLVAVMKGSGGTTELTNLLLSRGPVSTPLVLAEDATAVILYASESYAKGAGDTFAFTGLELSEDYDLAAHVDEAEAIAKLYAQGSYSGVRSATITMDFPAGDYIIQTDAIKSSDTDDAQSLFLFATANNAGLASALLYRDRPQTCRIHLASAAAKAMVYAATSYARSNADTFIWGNLRIWKVNRSIFGDNLIPVPTGFGWTDNPLVGHLYRTEQGIETDLDVRSYRPDASRKTYWVSPSGSDTDTGADADHPLQSIRTAINKSDAVIVMLKDGYYDSSLAPQHINGLTRSIAIVAAPGASPVIGSSAGTDSFTKTDGQTYVYETSANSNAVYDSAEKAPLTRVGSVAAVNTTAFSYYCDGVTTYVHTNDGSAPTSAIHCCVANENTRITASGLISVYIEGITFVGGAAGALRVTCDGTNRSKVYAKNCTFVGAEEWGACYLEGCESILQDCEAYGSVSDGFGHHAKTIVPHVIEIGCQGHHNGVVEGTKNGSTMHAGGSIIRVNGRYWANKGPNVADVHTGTESWNLACHAWKSAMSTDGIQNSDFVASDYSPNMWLDSCSGYGSTHSLLAYGYGTVRVRGCAFQTITVGEGCHLETY